VIYISTWVNGSPGSINGNSFPPFVTTETIALRNVREGGSLTPAEAALLGAILSTSAENRADDAFASVVTEHEVELWNDFLPALAVHKATSGVPAQLFILADTADANLAKRDWAKYFMLATDHEVRWIGGQSDGLQPVIATIGNMDGGKFYRNDTSAAGRVEAVRHGASMVQPLAGEERWTLAQWEASKICGHSINSISLAYWPFWLSVVPGDGRFSVSRDPVARKLDESKNSDASYLTLGRANLDWLFPSDVTAITWSSTLDDVTRTACKAR
jgi:hypothetical protein